MPLWTLLEGHEITEMRDDCVYRTRSVGYKWFEVGTSHLYAVSKRGGIGSIQWGSISTTIMTKMNHRNVIASKEAPPVPDWLPAYKEKEQS